MERPIVVGDCSDASSKIALGSSRAAWGKTKLTRSHVVSTLTTRSITTLKLPLGKLKLQRHQHSSPSLARLLDRDFRTEPGSFTAYLPGKMYELFLTALIEGVDVEPACAILSGVCGMQPWHSTERVLYFQGPARPAGMGNLNSLGPSIRDRQNRKAHQFKELHQKLSKESFILQTRFDVSKDTHLGPSAAPMDLNSSAGILRWTDFPDPTHNRPHLTSRGKVEIWDQPGLMTVMGDNQYMFVITTP